MMSYNLAALRHIQRINEYQQRAVTFVDEERTDDGIMSQLKDNGRTGDKKRKRTAVKT